MLLFDQNISYKVSKKIQDLFPGAKHLSDLRLESYTDIDIWQYARVNDFCIVTFDYDFIDLATLKGAPPKIIWLRSGNMATEVVVTKLRSHHIEIRKFIEDKETAFLEIR